MLTGVSAAVLFVVAYGGFELFKQLGIFPDGLGSAFFSTMCVFMALTGTETVRTVIIHDLPVDDEYVHDLELENALLRRDNSLLREENSDLSDWHQWVRVESFMNTLTCPVFGGYYESRAFACRYQCPLPLVLNSRRCYLTGHGPVCLD